MGHSVSCLSVSEWFQFYLILTVGFSRGGGLGKKGSSIKIVKSYHSGYFLIEVTSSPSMGTSLLLSLFCAFKKTEVKFFRHVCL